MFFVYIIKNKFFYLVGQVIVDLYLVVGVVYSIYFDWGLNVRFVFLLVVVVVVDDVMLVVELFVFVVGLNWQDICFRGFEYRNIEDEVLLVLKVE